MSKITQGMTMKVPPTVFLMEKNGINSCLDKTVLHFSILFSVGLLGSISYSILLEKMRK